MSDTIKQWCATCCRVVEGCGCAPQDARYVDEDPRPKSTYTWTREGLEQQRDAALEELVAVRKALGLKGGENTVERAKRLLAAREGLEYVVSAVGQEIASIDEMIDWARDVGTKILEGTIDRTSREKERTVKALRLALLGGPLGEPFGRDYDALPEHAREQIDGSIEGILERVDRERSSV